TPSIRQSEGEYGVSLEARNVSQSIDVEGLELTLWGSPWNILHNAQRGNCLNEAEPGFGWAKCSVGRPAKVSPLAYLTLPASCEGPLSSTATATSWQGAGSVTRTSQSAPLEGCDLLPFAPEAIARLSDPRASSPSGYEFDIDVDTEGVTNPLRL